jgi:hypothetical protein
LPPPPPPPPPPAPVAEAAPPPPPPVPVIPSELIKPVDIKDYSIGLQWVGGRNTGQYGRYNGFTYGGIDASLGFDVLHRDAFNSDKPFYYSITGANLDIQSGRHLTRTFTDPAYTNLTSNAIGPEAELKLNFGVQGQWGVDLGYNAITSTGNIIQSIWTLSGNTGRLNNNLLPMGGASNTTTTTTKGTVFSTSFNANTLPANFVSHETGTRRDQVDVGGKIELGEWTFATHLQHEWKQGSLEESIRQTWGGMAFTLPVDFETDRFDVSASYVDTDYQAVIQYTYSKFTDNNVGATLPFAVSQTALSASSGPYGQTSLYSTPPSNSAHYVTVMFNDKLAPHTRLNFNGRFGVELQDATFPANSADPGLSSTMGNPTYSWFTHLNALNQGTGVTSLGAAAWVYQVNTSFTTELADHLDAKIAYNLDARSAHWNARQVWFGGASLDANANSVAYSIPQNWVKQTGTAELTYLVLPESSTKIQATYSFNNATRTNAQVEHSETNTIGLNISSMLGKDVLARLSWEHANRAGTLHYGTAWGNLENGVPDPDNTPSGAYYQAPMVSDAITLRADYASDGDLTGGLFVKWAENRFHYPEVESVAIASPSNAGNWSIAGVGQGITDNSTLTIGPDVNYRVNAALNLHAYYSYERIYFDNRGNGACAELATGNCLGTVGYFQNKYTSSMHSAGVSSDWAITDKFKLSGEYNFSYGAVLFGQYNGVAVTTVSQSYQNVTNYPDINSSLHDLRLTASYQVTDNIEAALLYRYGMFTNNDWQYIPLPVIPTTNGGTAISIVNAGYGSPNYNVTTVGMTMRIKL